MGGDAKANRIDKHKSNHARMVADHQEKKMRAMIEDAQKISDAVRDVKDSIKTVNAAAISSMRDQVNAAQGHFLATYGSLMSGLSIAGQDFGNVTKETNKPLGAAILDALLVVASLVIAAPELATFKEAIDQANKAVRLPQLGAQAGKLYDLATSATYAAEATQMRHTRDVAAQFDAALTYALATLDQIRGLITAYEADPRNAVLTNTIRVMLDALKIAQTTTISAYKLNTPFYADAMLFDLLEVYAQKYVVIRWTETADTRRYWGRATIDNPALDDGISVDVKGMDGRELAYERLGSNSPFSAQLRKSGRPAVDSFRDLVKVWGARIDAQYYADPMETAVEGAGMLIDYALSPLRKDVP